MNALQLKAALATNRLAAATLAEMSNLLPEVACHASPAAVAFRTP
jgi:hypothetical protein